MLDNKLKDIDRSVGQTTREVGNYEEAVQKALNTNEQLQKVVQNTGAYKQLQGQLIALKGAYNDIAVTEGKASEEAKRLQAEINRLEGQMKQAANETEKTDTKFRSFRTSLLNSGGASQVFFRGLNAFRGITGIVGELGSMIDGLNEAKEAFDSFYSLFNPAFALSKKLDKAVEELTGDFVKERGELESLFSVAKDDNASREQRSAAIDAINEQYGQYLPNLLTESSSLEDIANAQNLATKALIDNIAARGARQALEDDINRIIAAERQAIELEEQAESTFGKIIGFSTRAAAAVASGFSTEFSGVGASLDPTEIQKNLNELEKTAAEEGIKRNDEQYNEERKQKEQQALEEQLQALTDARAQLVEAANLEALQIREARAKNEITQAQADQQNFEARKKAINEQLKEIATQQQTLLDLGLDAQSKANQELAVAIAVAFLTLAACLAANSCCLAISCAASVSCCILSSKNAFSSPVASCNRSVKALILFCRSCCNCSNLACCCCAPSSFAWSIKVFNRLSVFSTSVAVFVIASFRACFCLSLSSLTFLVSGGR